jgi:hypothetical protein
MLNEIETAHTTTQAERRRAFIAADEAWSAELRRCYGGGAGDARYIRAGKGEPGSTLRACHDAFVAAGDAWRRGM